MQGTHIKHQRNYQNLMFIELAKCCEKVVSEIRKHIKKLAKKHLGNVLLLDFDFHMLAVEYFLSSNVHGSVECVLYVFCSI